MPGLRRARTSLPRLASQFEPFPDLLCFFRRPTKALSAPAEAFAIALIELSFDFGHLRRSQFFQNRGTCGTRATVVLPSFLLFHRCPPVVLSWGSAQAVRPTQHVALDFAEFAFNGTFLRWRWLTGSATTRRPDRG